MAHRAVLIAGGTIFALGIVGYVYPINHVWSAFDIDSFCSNALFQFGKYASMQIKENCPIAKYIVFGTYGLMGVGGLLGILGVVYRK